MKYEYTGGVSFGTIELDKPGNSIAIGLFGSIGVMMIAVPDEPDPSALIWGPA